MAIIRSKTTTTLDRWLSDYETATYEVWESKESEVPAAITMSTNGSDDMLKITAEGFYVRGVKVPADDKEAETVYLAFKQWLAWANLQR